MAHACARLGSDTTRTVAKGLYNPFRSLTDSSGYSEGPVEEPEKRLKHPVAGCASSQKKKFFNSTTYAKKPQ